MFYISITIAIVFFVLIFLFNKNNDVLENNNENNYIHNTNTDKKISMIGFIPYKYRRTKKGTQTKQLLQIRKGELSIPKFFCYNFNMLTPVYDQMECPSCLPIAVSSFLSDRITLMLQKQVILSPQQLLQCYDFPNVCSNGIKTLELLDWIKKTNFKFVTENQLPYQGAILDIPCPQNGIYSIKEVKEITSFIPLEGYNPILLSKNINSMKNELLFNGPFIATINVYEDFKNFSFYRPYKSTNKEFITTHAIVIVGFCDANVDPREDYNEGYWICRNSWGRNWPKYNWVVPFPGYFCMPMGVNECGIESMAFAASPNVKENQQISSNDYFDNFTQYADKFLSF